MIVLWRVAYFKSYTYLRIKTVDLVGRKVRLSIKDEPVAARIKQSLDKKKRFYTAVIVGPGFG
jgi:hypothetical protein